MNLKIIISLILLIAADIVNGQSVDSTLVRYQEAFPKEKIHIHFDKSDYNNNETIWYKLYLLTGNEVRDFSKNIYIDWYDNDGRILKQTAAPLTQSTAKGSFDIPSNYKGGSIHLLAYTRWMLNEDSVFLYRKDLAIHNTPPKPSAKTVAMHTQVDVFPEGGQLVQGILSKIAFKATNQYGMPNWVNGILTNNKNEVLDSLRIQHDGMGVFHLNPKPGESYHLDWKDGYGNTGITSISTSKTAGATFTVSSNKDKATINITRTLDAPDNFKKMYLLVHNNEQTYYKVIVEMKSKTAQVAQLPTQNIPTGILQVSLFTSDWLPVAERIIFVNHGKQDFAVKLSVPQMNLNKRGKNTIELFVSDTALTNMSVAITDASVPVSQENTIYSDLLLSSDIKGKVYNPAYYFQNTSDSIIQHLDLVMLTNGWRKYDWEQIRAGVLPKITYPAEDHYLHIAGKVNTSASELSKAPLDLNLIFQSRDSSRDILSATIDKEGKFEIPGESFFYDTVKVYYSAKRDKKPVAIKQLSIENGLYQQMPKTAGRRTNAWNVNEVNPIYQIRSQFDSFLAKQEQLQKISGTTLNDVTVHASVKKPIELMDERYATGMFSGPFGYPLDVTQDKAVMPTGDILTYLVGRIPGIQRAFTGVRKDSLIIGWVSDPKSGLALPDLFLNEVKVSLETINSITISDIAFVKAFRPPFAGSSLGGAFGAIAIYTRKIEDMPNYDVVMSHVILGGYTKFKEFYNPSYEKSDDNMKFDVRSTLYWSPYVLTDKNNPQATIEFYNNDISKKLQIVIEGVNSTGKVVRLVQTIE